MAVEIRFTRFLTGLARPPSLLRVSPIYSLKQVAELCRRDADAVTCRRGPHEATSVQPLRIQRQTEHIVPQALEQIASTSAEYVKIARKGIALECRSEKGMWG